MNKRLNKKSILGTFALALLASTGVTIGAGTYTKMSQRTFKPNGCR